MSVHNYIKYLLIYLKKKPFEFNFILNKNYIFPLCIMLKHSYITPVIYQLTLGMFLSSPHFFKKTF